MLLLLISMGAKKLYIGYDIGGTKTEIVLIDDSKKILFQERMPTNRDLGYEQILSVLKSLFDACLDSLKIKPSEITSLGLALPGSVDPATQKMLIGNTRILEGKSIKEDLLNALSIDIPVYTENDANCFALAECHFGVGKNLPSQNMVGIILGTGVGGGIITNGKILRGKRGSAGEIGHTQLNSVQGVHHDCYCGQKDCVENYLSGTGFQEYYFEKTKQVASTSQIFQNKEFLMLYKEDLARFLGSLTNILDPDYFVLGGGVSKSDLLYPDLENLMIPHLFYKKDPPKIFKHALTDSAGSIGAALLGTL